MMVLQVHDELVFEADSRLRRHPARGGASNAWSPAAELRVPLVVDVGVGENWDEAH